MHPGVAHSALAAQEPAPWGLSSFIIGVVDGLLGGFRFGLLRAYLAQVFLVAIYVQFWCVCILEWRCWLTGCSSFLSAAILITMAQLTLPSLRESGQELKQKPCGILLTHLPREVATHRGLGPPTSVISQDNHSGFVKLKIKTNKHTGRVWVGNALGAGNKRCLQFCLPPAGVAITEAQR